MSSDQRSLADIIGELPPDSQAKVREFVETLLETTNGRSSKKLKQNWAGALSDYRETYTSLDLQKKSLEWRGD
jgi:hypothetical protein